MRTRQQAASRRSVGWQGSGMAVGSALLLSLVACGGGGEGASQSAPAAPLMRNDAAAGDYFIYAVTTTTMLPTGIPLATRNNTVTYRSVAVDGTNQRVSTTGGSSNLPIQQSTYDVDGAIMSTDGILGTPVAMCTYSVPQALTPPYPRSVGQTWSNTTVRTCGTAITNIVTSGSLTARENLVLPIGTLDTWRTTRTVTYTTSTDVAVQQLTCWYSAARGSMVRCDNTYQRTPNGAGTPDAVSSTTEVLTGAGGPGRTSEGNVQARFHGNWRVAFVGAVSGTCAVLTISAAGAINGSCTATGGTAFTVSGSVDIHGAVNLAWAGGGVLTGTLTSPYEGSGTWSEGVNSGTWTAQHQ